MIQETYLNTQKKQEITAFIGDFNAKVGKAQDSNMSIRKNTLDKLQTKMERY